MVSHPIQHFCPQYVSFARNKNVSFKVFFGSMLGLKKYFDPNFKKEISWGNLNLHLFDHSFLNGDQVIPSDGKLDAPALDAALVEFRPDLITIYGYFQKLQRRAHRWALANKVKLAYISDGELRQHRGRLKELVKFFFIKRYFSRISYFLSVGDANEDYYRHYGVSTDKIVRMHFPIDLDQFEARFAEKESLRIGIRNQYKIGGNQLVLLVVGKLVQWKNQDHIIKAMKLLEDEGIFTCLFILGSGEMFDRWKEEAQSLKQSVVHFPGFVNPEDLPAYYAAADIYVHPASMEPHSIAISEAIYMGCPIIISDRCGSYGPHDDVQEGKNGYVFQFGNVKQLSQCIRVLVNDENLRHNFRGHSHEIATQFQLSAHRESLGEILERLHDNYATDRK